MENADVHTSFSILRTLLGDTTKMDPNYVLPPGRVNSCNLTEGEYCYSNVGYMVAGALAEYVTNTPYETLLQDKIFTLLNMGTAEFGWPDPEHICYPNEPWGHRK